MFAADRYIPNTARLPEITAPRVGAELLVHDGPFVHQRHYNRLLHPGDRRLGLVEGQVEHRYGNIPDFPWRNRLQLHLADLPADARGQPRGPQQVRLDARLESHRRGSLQIHIRMGLLPHIPKRHAAGIRNV